MTIKTKVSLTQKTEKNFKHKKEKKISEKTPTSATLAK